MGVTREQAHWIASGYLRRNPINGRIVYKVLAYDEITSRKPCLYNVSEESLKQSWIAYTEIPEVFALQSSIIVVVLKDNGKIIYAGSASDEG